MEFTCSVEMEFSYGGWETIKYRNVLAPSYNGLHRTFIILEQIDNMVKNSIAIVAVPYA